MKIQEHINEKIRERVIYGESKNGLKVFFMPKVGYTKQYAIFSTNYGSIDNTFVPFGSNSEVRVPEGIAHFLEHKLFEEPDQNIFDKFSELGANVNAFTSFTQTSYLFNCTDNFYENLELLVHFVQNPHFTDENVEKEKGIIGQEIGMYEDNPNWKVFFNCMKTMYVEHPVKIDIAGTVDSIRTINKEWLTTCYNTFYNPSNMVLFVIGDLSFEDIMNIVNKTEKQTGEKVEKINRVFPEEPKKVQSQLIIEKMETAIPLFYMGFKDFDLGLKGSSQVKKDCITNIILEMLFGQSSLFFNELYIEGLLDNNFGSYYTGKETFGHSLIAGQSINPELVYEKIKDLINRPVEEILKQEDFIRIKRKDLGNFIMGLNSIEFIANNFVDLYFDEFNLLDYLALIETISFDDLLIRFKEHFTKDNFVLSIIKPIA